MTFAALGLAVVATALLMFGAGGGYRVHLTLDNAGQTFAKVAEARRSNSERQFVGCRSTTLETMGAGA